MNEYELTFVLDPVLKKNDKDEIQSKIEDWIKSLKGKITKFEDMGIRELAYEINKNKQALYMFFTITGEANFDKIIQNRVKEDKRIWRYLLVKKINKTK